MKKYLSLLFVLVLVFVLGAYKVSAREDEAERGGKMEYRKEAMDDWKSSHAEMKVKREAMMLEMKEKRESWKEDMKTHLKDSVEFIRTRVVMGLMQRTENLANIATRIESRIEKIEAEGKDTGEAQSFVDKAQTKLEIAKTNIENLKADIDGDGGSIDMLRASLSFIKENLKNAHGYLKSAVEEIKKVKTQ